MSVEVRVVSGMEQLERWVAVQNEVRPDDPETTAMKALIRAREPGHLDLLAFLDGEPAGAGMIADDAESRHSGHSWVVVNVPERHRGRGIGVALFSALSEQARDRGARGLACQVRADDAYSRSFLDRRGFVEYGRFDRCSLDLGGRDLTPAPLPAGVELTWLGERPDLLQDLHRVAAMTYPELGGNRARQAENFLEWQVYELGSPNTLLDAVPIAVAESGVVGYATMRRLLDSSKGELRTVLVLADRRRQGIASALLRAQAARAHDAGIREIRAWVRHTQPLELFLSLGFCVQDASILLRGPLL